MKKLLKLLMIGIIVLSSNVTFAQFIGAAITETAVLSSAVYSTHTGNDYLDDGANTYRVFVWDDLSATRPGIGWDYNSGSQAGYSVFNYSTDIIDPDVSIVIDGNSDVHALVVYYDNNNSQYIMEDWIWNGSTTFTNNGDYQITAAVPFGTTINIDSDQNNSSFIAIWDDGSNGDLVVITGNYAGTSINFGNGGNTNPAPLSMVGSNSGSGTMPDVCLFAASDKVTYTYITNNGDLFIDEDVFSVLDNGFVSSSTNLKQENTSTGNDAFSYPRIACPNSNSSLNSICFAVVVVILPIIWTKGAVC